MFKKKEKTEKAPKNKKVRTMKVGTHKKSVLLLWAVLLASTSFGVYKNFTAIDTHTVHEKEIIQLRLNDTNGIENFVKNFAKAYYSWDTSKEAIEARTTEISKYLTKELQDLNADTIRTDIPTSVTVTNVLVWNVEQSGMNDFTVAYEVDQQVKEAFTLNVQISKEQQLITNGMYKFVRHPAYTGSILSLLGVSIALKNIPAILIVAICSFVCYQIRINVEEAVLQKYFKEYNLYKEKTYKLFPYP